MGIVPQLNSHFFFFLKKNKKLKSEFEWYLLNKRSTVEVSFRAAYFVLEKVFSIGFPSRACCSVAELEKILIGGRT